MTRIGIIGGGISGLAAAWHLQRSEVTNDLDVTIFERSSQLGGKISTVRQDGFTIEGGPDSFVTYKPAAKQLCMELGLEDELIPTNPDVKSVYIVKNSKLLPMPVGMRLAVPTNAVAFATTSLISAGGKSRMLGEAFVKPRMDAEDESLADFIRRRLGQEALDRIGGPLMAGIYMADPEELSIQATYPQFVAMEREHGSLIKGMKAAAASRPKPKPGSSMFSSLRGGMQALIEALEQQLTAEIALNADVAAISHEAGKWHVEAGGDRHAFDILLLACPAPVAGRLISAESADLASLLSNLTHASSAVVTLAFRRSELADPTVFDGYGFVVPHIEGRPLRSCTWSSTKLPGRAPEEFALIRMFFGGAGDKNTPALQDDELKSLARQQRSFATLTRHRSIW
jgi:oxygen-dependent protoporphyrinogen oxidase